MDCDCTIKIHQMLRYTVYILSSAQTGTPPPGPQDGHSLPRQCCTLQTYTCSRSQTDSTGQSCNAFYTWYILVQQCEQYHIPSFAVVQWCLRYYSSEGKKINMQVNEQRFKRKVKPRNPARLYLRLQVQEPFTAYCFASWLNMIECRQVALNRWCAETGRWSHGHLQAASGVGGTVPLALSLMSWVSSARQVRTCCTLLDHWTSHSDTRTKPFVAMSTATATHDSAVSRSCKVSFSKMCCDMIIPWSLANERSPSPASQPISGTGTFVVSPSSRCQEEFSRFQLLEAMF